MGDNVKIYDTKALADIKSALGNFSSEAQHALGSVESEIYQTQTWLQQRENYWRRKVEEARQDVERAQQALARCQQSQRQNKDGERTCPDCSAEQAALNRALHHLREMEAKLNKVLEWKGKFEQAVGQYRSQATQLRALVTSRTQRAQTLLNKAITHLERYREAKGAVAGAVLARGIIHNSSSTLKTSSAKRGSKFENWANKYVFGDKRRVTIHPENNAHLIKADKDGLGLSSSRTTDNYVDKDGSLWDAKAYNKNSRVDRDQLRDYQLMVEAGKVYDSQDNEIKVTSINYLFSSRAAAETNAWILRGEANTWYVNEVGKVQLLNY